MFLFPISSWRVRRRVTSNEITQRDVHLCRGDEPPPAPLSEETARASQEALSHEMGGRPGAVTGSPAGDAGVTAAPLLGDRLTADHTVDSTQRSRRAESDAAGHAVLEGLHRKSYKYPRGCVRNRSSFLLQRGSRLAIASIKHTNLGRLHPLRK